MMDRLGIEPRTYWLTEKEAQKKYQALIDESQELDEMELEIDHLFSEYDKKNQIGNGYRFRRGNSEQ